MDLSYSNTLKKRGFYELRAKNEYQWCSFLEFVVYYYYQRPSNTTKKKRR